MQWKGSNFDGNLGVKEIARIVRGEIRSRQREGSLPSGKVSVRVHHQRYVHERSPESFSIHITVNDSVNRESLALGAFLIAKSYQKIDGDWNQDTWVSNYWVNTFVRPHVRFRVPHSVEMKVACV